MMIWVPVAMMVLLWTLVPEGKREEGKFDLSEREGREGENEANRCLNA